MAMTAVKGYLRVKGEISEREKLGLRDPKHKICCCKLLPWIHS
jgi:hypothetical protein